MPIAPPLLRWYDRTKRDLPWRRDPTAYKTLVSELMLQQTTVAAVIPYFLGFIARFPTLASLAAASEDEVTALWSGLGYYARARNLRLAAVATVDNHGGELPRSEAALGELPGLGPYTAAAVAAIAFGVRTFALDGNGARVMSRLGGVSDSIDLPATRLRLRAAGAREVPRGRPGDFTQAVMELGATVCTPRNPRCDACPLRASCAARAAGTVEEIPRRTKRMARPVVRVACACLTDGARVLLVRRRHGLLAGTWSLPEAPLASAAASHEAADVARKAAADFGVGVRVAEVAHHGAVRHVFTHRDVTAEVFRIDVSRAVRPRADQRWVPPAGMKELGVSSFTRKTVALGLGSKRDNVARRS
jgi:A/G-specific adenine glycosylase